MHILSTLTLLFSATQAHLAAHPTPITAVPNLLDRRRIPVHTWTAPLIGRTPDSSTAPTAPTSSSPASPTSSPGPTTWTLSRILSVLTTTFVDLDTIVLGYNGTSAYVEQYASGIDAAFDSIQEAKVGAQSLNMQALQDVAPLQDQMQRLDALGDRFLRDLVGKKKEVVAMGSCGQVVELLYALDSKLDDLMQTILTKFSADAQPLGNEAVRAMDIDFGSAANNFADCAEGSSASSSTPGDSGNMSGGGTAKTGSRSGGSGGGSDTSSATSGPTGAAASLMRRGEGITGLAVVAPVAVPVAIAWGLWVL